MKSSLRNREGNDIEILTLRKRQRPQGSSLVPGTSSSRSSNDKYVVSDDDDSVLNAIEHPAEKISRKKRKVSTKNENTITIKPLEPMPLKLNKSQIHSKKYPFPQKLFDLLKKASLDDRSSKVVSWSPDGTIFVVHDHARFAAEFLPTYFGHTQFRSFDRQLNYWGFELVSPRQINNKSFGGKSWKHPFFQKDRRDILKHVTRKMPAGSSSRNKSSHKKLIKEKKPRSVIRKTKKTTSRVTKRHQKRDESEIEESIDDFVPIPIDPRLRTRLRVGNTANKLSTELGPPLPRMVSPVQGRSCIESINNPLHDTISSALNIVQQNCNCQTTDQSSVFTNIEDEFLPLFPLEFLDDDCTYKPIPPPMESVGTNDIAPSDPELFTSVDVFEGNSFHDVGPTMDVGIDTTMNIEMDTIVDENELFLSIVEDRGNKR